MAALSRTRFVPQSPARSRQRADLQGLRALAVLAVIFDHLTGWPNGGFVGVDVFFVLSGFFITGLLLRELGSTGKVSFAGFYRRRIKRIIPAAVLVTVTTIVATYVLYGSVRATSTFWDGVWATLFSANWNFAAQGTDYFQLGGPTSPLQHYWSLSVEEQFYFVWPVVMVFIYWLFRTRKNTSDNTARRHVGTAIIVITASSFAWAIWETATNPSLAYFSTFSRTWELGIGAGVAVFANSFSRIPGWIRPVLGWIGLAGIIGSLFVVDSENAFPAPWAALPVLSTAIVIIAGTGGDQRFLSPIMNRGTSYIGDISYSLYLWHFPVVILLLAFFAADSWIYYVVVLALTGILSAASYHLVENPVRQSAWLESKQTREARRSSLQPNLRLSLGWLTVLALVAGGLTVAAIQPRSGTASDDQLASQLNPAASSDAVEPSALPLCLGAASLDASAICDPALGDAVTPAPAALESDTGNSYKCFPNEDQPMKSCVYGLADSDLRVALVGDSHAASLLPGLALQARDMGWRLDTYTGAACLWIEEDSCAGMPAIQEALIGGSYDIVLTSAYRGSGDTNKVAQSRAYAATWAPVAETGAKIIAIADVPGGAGEAVACVTRITFDLRNNDCAVPLDQAFRVQDAAAMAASIVDGASVVETRDYFCSEDSCPAVIGNVIVYRDGISHISASYSKTVGPYLARDIMVAASMDIPAGQ